MLTLFVVLLTWSAVAASPVFQEVTPGSAEQEVTPGSANNLNVDGYLRRYGYMANNMDERAEDYVERRRDAIKLFQRFFGLEVTGETNEATRESMLKPRCGMKDIEIGRPANVVRWNQSEVTYNIIKYTRDIPESLTLDAIRGALNEWSGPSGLTFTHDKSYKAIIKLKFVTGDHPPCPVPMDGVGRSLAHAYNPSSDESAGDVHFDDAETYIYREGEGNIVESVALHELGHSLGLTHDELETSIMTPYYTGRTTLGPNDILKIKALYS